MRRGVVGRVVASRGRTVIGLRCRRELPATAATSVASSCGCHAAATLYWCHAAAATCCGCHAAASWVGADWQHGVELHAAHRRCGGWRRSARLCSLARHSSRRTELPLGVGCTRAPYVDWVEQERGLRFLHPVHVDFLTPAQYSDYMRVDTSDLSDEERDELDQSVAMFRALGLVSGSFDMAEVLNEMYDAGTLAVYSFDDRRIRLRGTELDVNMQVTLVHELVHALQDQHFDLRRMNQLETSGEAAAFRAVVEGDATLVEQFFIESLSSADQDAYYAQSAQDREDFDIGGIPEIVVALFGAPYALGTPMVELAYAEDGWEGVNRLLDEPPTNELPLLDSFRVLDGFLPAGVSGDLDVADDEEILDLDQLGPLSLYFLLASRGDPLRALAVADGWDGDSIVSTTNLHNGTVCVYATIAASGAPAHDLLSSAIHEWVNGSPSASEAWARTTDEFVSFRSCDPGGDVEATIVTSGLDALAVVQMRSLLRVWLHDMGDLSTVVCAVDSVLAGVPIEALSDPDPSPEVVGEVQEIIRSSVAACAAA